MILDFSYIKMIGNNGPCGNVDKCPAFIQMIVGKSKTFPSDCGKPVVSFAVHQVFHMSINHGISTRLKRSSGSIVVDKRIGFLYSVVNKNNNRRKGGIRWPRST